MFKSYSFLFFDPNKAGKRTKPISHDEVLSDKDLKGRCLRSRAAYCDKNRGNGELKAKRRVVALGRTDPDLFSLGRLPPLEVRHDGSWLITTVIWPTHHAGGHGLEMPAQLASKGHSQTMKGHLWPPKGPLIDVTKRWKSRLYGLSSGAPRS